jgi:integrase
MISATAGPPWRCKPESTKVVQERLRHANIGITLDTYSPVTAGLHSDAAEKVADIVFGVR